MRSGLLVPLVLVAAIEPAHATTCVLGPFVRPAHDPPADCTIVYYRLAAGLDDPPPRATVYRANAPIDVTATSVKVGTQELDQAIYTLDCDYQVVSETHYQEPFDVFHITLEGALPNEHVNIGQLQLTVQPAGGACDTSELPSGSCSGMYDWSQCEPMQQPGDEVPAPETEDAVGCSATNGASSSLLGVVLLALSSRMRDRCRGGAVAAKPDRPASRLLPRSRPSSSRDPRRARSARSDES
jgi:hypothetical protein